MQNFAGKNFQQSVHTGPICGRNRTNRGSVTGKNSPFLSVSGDSACNFGQEKQERRAGSKIFITFEMNLHVKLIPFTMKQLCTLLCLLLLGGACSDDDTPNPAVKFSSPDSDVKISQDGTSAAITATHHAGQFVLTMEKNFEAVPESDRSWCTAVLSGDRLTVEIEENAEELRNAAISIMNGESVIGKITVEQGVAPTLSLGSSTAEFTNEGGELTPSR